MKKVKVVLKPRDEAPEVEMTLDDAIVNSDWTEDPVDGKAVLLPDGSELVNPLPVAPPVSYIKDMSLNDMVAAHLARHMAALKGDDEIDSVSDMDDFGEDVDDFPISPYEVVMADEFPAIPVVAELEPPAPAAPEPVAPVPVSPA